MLVDVQNPVDPITHNRQPAVSISNENWGFKENGQGSYTRYAAQ
jgi:hypothetical protein